VKNWIFKDEPSSPPDPKAERTRVILLSLPFALLGLAALVMLVHDMIGGLPRQRIMTILSFIAACIGFVALIFGINAKKMAIKTSGLKSAAPGALEKPWLERPDWAAGRITSGARKSVILLWIFVIFWLAVSTVITVLAVPPELQRGNHAALIALVFPLIGLAVLVFAANTTRACGPNTACTSA
jgi:hypothetical protein